MQMVVLIAYRPPPPPTPRPPGVDMVYNCLSYQRGRGVSFIVLYLAFLAKNQCGISPSYYTNYIPGYWKVATG